MRLERLDQVMVEVIVFYISQIINAKGAFSLARALLGEYYGAVFSSTV